MVQIDLEKFREPMIQSCDTERLIDIQSTKVNQALPVGDRLTDFIAQIKNPYLFKAGDLSVSIRFTNCVDLTDSLVSALGDLA